MAKKKAAEGWPAGSRVRVKSGVVSPEFPEVSIGGWSGMILEATGKPPLMTYLVEWDDQTLSAMPAEYVQKCESQQLYHRMASLSEADLEMH